MLYSGMEKICEVPPEACAAAEYARFVDERLNVAAIREFREATSETQESGADLGEGSAYLDTTPVRFTAQSVTCGVCNSLVELSRAGWIRAADCPISGSCELLWAKMYPDNYKNESGEINVGKLLCGAEIGCKARIGWKNTDDGIKPAVISRACEVEKRGCDWRKRCDDAVSSAVLVDPDRGIEKFDGEGSGREQVEREQEEGDQGIA